MGGCRLGVPEDDPEAARTVLLELEQLPAQSGPSLLPHSLGAYSGLFVLELAVKFKVDT